MLVSALKRLPIAISILLIATGAFDPARAEQQYSVNGRPVSASVYQAGKILNDSVGLLQQNRNQEAVDMLLQAEQMAPDLAGVHLNLGLGLAKLGRSQEAVKELETARSLDPNMPNTLLTLGGLYQSQGQVINAISTYSEFVSRFPQHKDAAKVQALVTGLKKEVADGVIQPALMNANGTPSDNYLGELGSHAKRWPAAKLPIKVFIQPGDGVPGYKPKDLTILQQAFTAWQEASQGNLTFAMVPDQSQADLVCSFISDPSGFRNQAEAGETNLFANSKGPVKGTIQILTLPLVAELPLTDNRIRFFCLHEVGHAIGFGGHTSNPQDIMFYSSSVSDAFPHLSPRDSNSVRMLYAQ